MSGTEGRVNRMSEYIEREKAIEYFMINTNWRDEDGCLIDDWDEKRKLLEDYFNGVPSADVRPVVHGEWIKTMEGNAFRDKCSECESLYPNAFGYNWCPACGAKMDRKGEDE